MAIKEILNKLAGLLPEDSSEAKSLLADAKRETETILDDLKSANSESAQRKAKLRELQAELDSKGDFTETESKLKSRIAELEKIEAKYNQEQQANNDRIVADWVTKSAILNIGKEDKRFDRIQAIRSEFVMPAEGETLTTEQAKANMDKLNLLEKSGVFVTESGHTPNYQAPKPTDGQAPTHTSSGAAVAHQLGYK